jgi:hypothetical protein
MINVWGDRYANYPDLIITHCVHVMKYHTGLINIYGYVLSAAIFSWKDYTLLFFLFVIFNMYLLYKIMGSLWHFIYVYNVLWSYLSPNYHIFFPAHWSLLSQTVYHLLSCLFKKKSRFHIWQKTYNICFSESGLYCITWWSPISHILLQMTWFHPSSWLIMYMWHIILDYVCVAHYLYTLGYCEGYCNKHERADLHSSRYKIYSHEWYSKIIILFLVFWGTFILVFLVAALIYISTNNI